jgi:hypothetical protein
MKGLTAKRFSPAAILLFLLLIVIIGFLSPYKTAAAPVTASANVDRDFGFGSMEIFQFKYDTHLLTSHDMNADGMEDILFINNKASRMEVLIRIPAKDGSTPQSTGPSHNEKPLLPRLKERFINRGFILDQWIKVFLVADVNGDQRPDIISVGDRLGIIVHFQQENGSFGKPQNRYIENASALADICARDLDNDDFPDILVTRKTDAEILWNNGTGQFKSSTPINFSSSHCSRGLAGDFDGDRIPDLLFYARGDNPSLNLRPGIGNRRFGWEESLPVPSLRSIKTVDLPLKSTPNKSSHNSSNHNKSITNGTAQIAAILQNGLILRLYGFNREKQGPLLDAVDVQLRRLSLTGMNPKEDPAWITADLNRDGFDDFCIAAPQLNQLHIYSGTASTLHPTPKTIDTLTAVNSLKRTRNNDLVVFSSTEKAIAIHPHNKLDSFPTFFKAPGKPIAMDVGLPSTVFGVFKDKDNYVLNLFNSKNPGSSPSMSLELSLHNAPRNLKVFPLPGDNHFLVMMFIPYDRPAVFRLHKGQLLPITPDVFRAASLNLTAANITAIKYSPTLELLVNEEKVARIYSWSNNAFSVKQQLNPQRPNALISAACNFSDSRGKPGFLLYDSPGKNLIWFPDSPNKKPTLIRFKNQPQAITGLSPLFLDNKKSLLLISRSALLLFSQHSPNLSIKTISEYSSRTEKPTFWSVIPTTLGSPGKNMLALIDANNRSIEIVSTRNNSLTEALIFEVFQDAGYSETTETYEPHSLTTGDFNGDSIQDMAVLVHDKLIIYIGE